MKIDRQWPADRGRTFHLCVNGQLVDVVVVTDSSNASLADLVEDMNLALSTAGVLDWCGLEQSTIDCGSLPQMQSM